MGTHARECRIATSPRLLGDQIYMTFIGTVPENPASWPLMHWNRWHRGLAARKALENSIISSWDSTLSSHRVANNGGRGKGRAPE